MMIRIENLYKIYGKHPEKAMELLEKGLTREQIKEKTGEVVAIQDVSFEVRRGETFVLMGLSGSGKSTLLRCINRLVEPTSGTVYIEDRDVVNMDKNDLVMFRREKIGMVFQSFALLPFRTVFDNVKLGLEIRGLHENEIKNKVMEALEMVGLEEWRDSYPDELSGGMQQRVGTARVIATGQEILLMDEPFGALDPLIRRMNQDELLELEKRIHKTIIFVTHDLAEAIKMGDRIAIMNPEGKIVQIGTSSDIVKHQADDYVRDFTQDMVRFFAVGRKKKKLQITFKKM